MADEDKVYEEYLRLRYELTSDLKMLTENVNRLSASVEKRFDDQDDEIDKINIKIDTKLQGSPGAGSKEGSSLPSKEKYILVIVLSIAFLGCLGAAIGINLLEYFKPPV